MSKNKTSKAIDLIRQLNPKIQGWVNYFRHGVAKKTFQRVDHFIFQALWRWAKRRHPGKGLRWVKKKYFGTLSNDHWVFFSRYVDQEGQPSHLYIFQAVKVPIKRHIKVKAEANPYDPKYRDYFIQRESRQLRTGSG